MSESKPERAGLRGLKEKAPKDLLLEPYEKELWLCWEVAGAQGSPVTRHQGGKPC